MSMTDRIDPAARILRQHDTLGVFPIPDVRFAQKMATASKFSHKKYTLLSNL
jgi:hypothetical protein